MIRALVVPAKDSEPVRVEQVSGSLEDWQRLVGGHIEAAPVPFIGITIYIHNEGKFAVPIRPNSRATLYWHLLDPRFRGQDFLAGDAVVIGIDPAGEDVDVPDDVLEHFDVSP